MTETPTPSDAKNIARLKTVDTEFNSKEENNTTK